MKFTAPVFGAIATFWIASVVAGPNLVPKVRDFSIDLSYTPTQHEIDDGCIPSGSHKVLRFDFVSQNLGDADFDVGSPVSRPDLFYFDTAHQHYHMRQFNQYKLYDSTGNLVVPSTKPGFCLRDSVKIRTSAGSAKFTGCGANDGEGISAGWADLYSTSTLCQFLVIDHVSNGDYTLVVTTNAAQAVPEDTFADNTISRGLHIQRNTVQQLENPSAGPNSRPLSVTVTGSITNNFNSITSSSLGLLT